MKTNSRLSLGLVCAVTGMMLSGSGCASYSTLDLRVQVPDNPKEGRAVAIVRVTDKRQFIEPRGWGNFNMTVPLTGLLHRADVGNTAVTTRAIAYNTPKFFRAPGVYLLPEGRGVEDVVRELLTRSFREAGYRVVDPASAVQEKATPVEADIDYFWCGLRDEAWAMALVFESRLRISGDLPSLKSVEPVRARLTLHTQNAGVARGWMKTLRKGIDVLVRETKRRLAGQPPSPPADESAKDSEDPASDDRRDADRLKKLDQMKKDGVITEEEYRRKRQEIIDAI